MQYDYGNFRVIQTSGRRGERERRHAADEIVAGATTYLASLDTYS